MIRSSVLNLAEEAIQKFVSGAAQKIDAGHFPLLQVFARGQEAQERFRVPRQQLGALQGGAADFSA